MVRAGAAGGVQDCPRAPSEGLAQDPSRRKGEFTLSALLHDSQPIAVPKGHRRGAEGLVAHVNR